MFAEILNLEFRLPNLESCFLNLQSPAPNLECDALGFRKPLPDPGFSGRGGPKRASSDRAPQACLLLGDLSFGAWPT